MKLLEFKYQKPGEPAPTKRRVIVLHEDDDHVAGIDLDKLDKDEQASLQKAFDEFQDEASKYMAKAFRNFKKAAIID